MFFFLSSGAILQELFREGGWAIDPAWSPFIWGPIFVVAAGLAVARRRMVWEAIRVFRKDLLLLAFLVYAVLSITWAIGPVSTGGGLIILAGLTLFSVYIAARFSLYEIYRSAGWALFLAGVLSVITVLFFPEVGLKYENESIWLEGVFGNKNVLGRAVSLGAAISFFLCRDNQVQHRKFWGVSFALLLAITVFSQSKTSLLVLVTIMLLSPLFRFLQAPGKLAIPAFVTLGGIVSGVLGFAYINLDQFLSLLDRGATLSGRIPMWAASAVVISDRPWLGYGYGASLEKQVSTYEYMRYIDWNPSHAHNSFLQMAFELGLVGVVIFLLHFIFFTKRSILWSRTHHQSLAAFIPLAFLLTMLISGLTQSIFLPRYGGIFWVLYVSTSISMNKKNK
jgi:O-antigen ligase